MARRGRWVAGAEVGGVRGEGGEGGEGGEVGLTGDGDALSLTLSQSIKLKN